MQFVSKRSKPINSFYGILISHSSKTLSQMICHFSTFPLSQQMFVVRFATCMELVLRIAMLKAVMFFSRGVQIGIEYVQSFVISGVRRQLVNYHAVQQSQNGVDLSVCSVSLASGDLWAPCFGWRLRCLNHRLRAKRHQMDTLVTK